jgi:hypothetical protein
MESARTRKYLKLARGIRYRTMVAVLAKEVLVRAERTVVDDVLHGLRGLLPRPLNCAYPPAPGLPTVTKFSLLDLEFSMPAGAKLPRLKFSQLVELGLVRSRPRDHAQDVSASEEADGCVEQLLEEIEGGEAVLKVMLDAVDDDRSIQQRVRDATRPLRAGYLPATFRVRDCCITNAPTIWLEKHFYL